MENLIFIDEANCCVYSTQPTDVYWYYYDFCPDEWENEQVVKDVNVPEKSIIVSRDIIAKKIKDDIKEKNKIYRKFRQPERKNVSKINSVLLA